MVALRNSPKQVQTLRQLESLAKKAGLRVSWGRLRFAGLRLKGGHCLLRGEKWLVMDREQDFDDQVEAFRQALDQTDMNQLEVPPEIAALLERQPRGRPRGGRRS